MFRPAHIHVKVSAPGHTLVTTRLYFEADEFNDGDPFILDSLIMGLDDDGAGGKRANFDFAIAAA